MRSTFITLYNGAAVPRREIPQKSHAEFLHGILDATDHGWGVSAYFGAQAGHLLRLFCLMASEAEGMLALASTAVTGESIPSLARLCPQLGLFERAMADQYGLKIEDHPWL